MKKIGKKDSLQTQYLTSVITKFDYIVKSKLNFLNEKSTACILISFVTLTPRFAAYVKGLKVSRPQQWHATGWCLAQPGLNDAAGKARQAVKRRAPRSQRHARRCGVRRYYGAAGFAEKELHNLQICYQPISRISINSKSLWEMQLRLSPSYAGLYRAPRRAPPPPGRACCMQLQKQPANAKISKELFYLASTPYICCQYYLCIEDFFPDGGKHNKNVVQISLSFYNVQKQRIGKTWSIEYIFNSELTIYESRKGIVSWFFCHTHSDFYNVYLLLLDITKRQTLLRSL